VNRLEVVECNLTGESDPVPKNTLAIRVKTRKIPIAKCAANAFMSTMIARGSALGIVVRVGEATEIGKINAALAEEASLSPAEAKSPLQRKLSRLGFFLVVLAVSLSLVVAVAGISWGKSVTEMIPVAISLAVSVIPEGLVAVVTVTMAIGVSRLAKQHAIVRKMPAVETLGAVTTICSDKTGTLTEGRMRVRMMKSTSALVGDGTGSDATEQIPWLITAYCNNSALTLHTDGTTEFAGDNTEVLT
jgi:Ca2+-transporting ATPase